MDSLLYFLIWAGLIFVMMRFGFGAHVMGRGQTQGDQGAAAGDGGLRWIAPENDTDPVCGMRVRTKDAKSAIHDGTVYYFCSSECRETFEARPRTYAGPATTRGVTWLEHAHD